MDSRRGDTHFASNPSFPREREPTPNANDSDTPPFAFLTGDTHAAATPQKWSERFAQGQYGAQR
jgi:hypothetical protein